ncbi:MAG: rod shape-determining protein RodA [Bdellovibrio sp.]|nr:MAG: rod shape-determining protein RodA [Bdellovibrio sp.]
MKLPFDEQLTKKLDLNFIFVILALNIIGLINLYSATHGASSLENSRLFWQQIAWLALGWATFFTVTFIDYKIFNRLAYPIYFIHLFLLVLVLLIGKKSLGAQRWLNLGFFRFQPSETIKLSIVLIMAHILSTKKIKKSGLQFKDLLYPLFVVSIPFLLIVKQPDLGTALLIVLIVFSMLFFAKIKRNLLIAFFILGLIGASLGWNFALKPYQKGRIMTFLSPGSDPRGAGYNSIQSKIAVGSGKFWGKGFRKGTQSQLEFLPERHTDFIYSVLSEEHGFLGSFTTLAIYIYLLFLCLQIGSRAKDRFGMFVVLGVTAFIFWHMFINICMVIGLMPIVGVPLPLLSYGGSSMLATMAGLGLISAVAYRRYLF